MLRAKRSYLQLDTWSREVFKFGIARDVPPRNLKVDPYKTIFFSRIVDLFIYESIQFWAKLSKITRFFQNCLTFKTILVQIWENFEKKKKKTTHSHFAVYKVSFIRIPSDWFYYPCWRHIPVGSFVPSTPVRAYDTVGNYSKISTWHLKECI